MDRPSVPRLRLAFAGGAVVAASIAMIFATVGDGVSAPENSGGIEAALIDHAHTLTWILLTIALSIAAWKRSWTSGSGRIAGIGLALYLAFLLALISAN